MSDSITIAAPARITRTQLGLIIPVEVVDGALPPPPPGLPPYPLASDPSQSWYLTYLDGQLTWVQSNAGPAAVLALEDGRGLFLLEDGAGFFLLEV